MPMEQCPRATEQASAGADDRAGEIPEAPDERQAGKVSVRQVKAAFGPILDESRFVLWSDRPNRKDPAKRDKVPIVAAGRRAGASSTNPCVRIVITRPDAIAPGSSVPHGTWVFGTTR